MASDPARVRLLWDTLSLVLPVMPGHTTASRSPSLAFAAAIHFVMKCSAPCSAVLRRSPSSKAAVVHWSVLMPKALRSSRKQPIHYFPCPPIQPAPPNNSLSITHFGSFVSSMRYKSRKQGPPPCVKSPRCLISRLDKRVHIGNRVVGAIALSPTDAASQEPVVGSAQCVVVASGRAPCDAAALSRVPRLLASGF